MKYECEECGFAAMMFPEDDDYPVCPECGNAMEATT